MTDIWFLGLLPEGLEIFDFNAVKIEEKIKPNKK